VLGSAGEEEIYGDAEHTRDLLQPTRPDPICALLVFLDLLKGQAERLTELLLAHLHHHATHAHTTADVAIDLVRRLFHDVTTFVPTGAAPGLASAYAV
jgi:hypothetical protein